MDEEAKAIGESKLLGAAVDYKPLAQNSSRPLDNVLIIWEAWSFSSMATALWVSPMGR